MIKIDQWYEILIVVVGLLCAIGMILAFISRGGRIKLGSAQIDEDDDDAPKPIVSESSKILIELQKGNAAAETNIELLTKMVSGMAIQIGGLDKMQRAELQAIDVLLGIAEGEEKNGQIKEARKSLIRAEGYKDAGADIGGRDAD